MSIDDYIPTLPPDQSVVFVVGAFAHGDINPDYIEETVSISQYPLSAAVTCSKLSNAFEKHWGIL